MSEKQTIDASEIEFVIDGAINELQVLQKRVNVNFPEFKHPLITKLNYLKSKLVEGVLIVDNRI